MKFTSYNLVAVVQRKVHQCYWIVSHRLYDPMVTYMFPAMDTCKFRYSRRVLVHTFSGSFPRVAIHYSLWCFMPRWLNVQCAVWEVLSLNFQNWSLLLYEIVTYLKRTSLIQNNIHSFSIKYSQPCVRRVRLSIWRFPNLAARGSLNDAFLTGKRSRSGI